MSFLGTAEFKVGAMVLSIAGLIAFMSMQVSDDPSYMGRSKKAWFLLPNANGLIKGSAIRSAGIPVGVIKEVKLQDGQARIDVTIQSDINLTRSSAVELRANGILGDKYIEVYPGSPTDAALEEDGQILNVKKGGSLDDVMEQVSDITGSLKDVAKNFNESVTNNGTNQHILGRIVLNIERLTNDLASMTSDNKEKIVEIIDQVHNITGTLDDLVGDESDKGFKKTWQNAMVRIDKSLKNIEEITDKVNRGDGAIGKLISDEKTGEDVASAIEGISGMVDSANKVSMGIDFNGYYLNEVNAAQTAVGVKIQPGLDRYYYLGIITDPTGVVENTNVKTTTGGTTTDVDEVKTFKSKTKLTALYAKNIYDFTFKAGLIENTGGLGIDYSFYRQRFVASVEAFDFEKTQLRTSLNLQLPYGLYIKGGYSDMLDKNNARSVFAGAGIFLTNDDLKLLLTKSPF